MEAILSVTARKMLLASSKQTEAREATEHPRGQKTASSLQPHHHDLIPNVNYAEVEKICFRAKPLQLLFN